MLINKYKKVPFSSSFDCGESHITVAFFFPVVKLQWLTVRLDCVTYQKTKYAVNIAHS